MLERILPLSILGLLAAIVAVWFIPGQDWAPPAVVKPEVETPADFADLPMANEHLTAAGEALARPMFWPSRKPLSAAAPEAVVAPELPPMEVLGLIGRGEGSVLIVKYEEGVKRLVAGQDIAGWRFERVDGDNATFSQGERTLQQPIPRPRVDALPRRAAP